MAYTINEFLHRSSREAEAQQVRLSDFKDKYIYLNPSSIELAIDLINLGHKVAYSDGVGFGHCFLSDFEIGKKYNNVRDYIKNQPEKLINLCKFYTDKEWESMISAVKSTGPVYSVSNVNNCIFADAACKFIFVNKDDFSIITNRFKGDLKFSYSENDDQFQVIDILSLTTKTIKKSAHLPRGFTFSHHSLVEPGVEDVPKLFGKVYSLYGTNSDFGKLTADYYAAMAAAKNPSNPINQISTSISKDLLNGMLAKKSSEGTKATFSSSEFMSKNLEFSECCTLFFMCANHCKKIVIGNKPYPFFPNELEIAVEPLSAIMKAFDSVLLTMNSRAYKTSCSIWLEEILKLLQKASTSEFQTCKEFIQNFIHDTLLSPGPITKEMVDKIYLTLSGASGPESITITDSSGRVLEKLCSTPDQTSNSLRATQSGQASSSFKLEEVQPGQSISSNIIGAKLYDTSYLTKSIQQEEDAKLLSKLEESIKASKVEKKVQEKEMTKLSLVQDAKATYDKAKFRVAQRQIVRRVRDALIMGLNALGGDRSEIKAIEKALKTNIGEGGLALLIGFVAHRSDFMSQHPGVVKVIEEMKVEGMAQIGDDIIETIAGQVMPLVMSVVDSSIAAIPEVHIEVKEKPTKKVRIRKPKADDEEAELEQVAIEQALKDEHRQAAAIAK